MTYARTAAVLLGAAAVLACVSLWHLTQGTSQVDPARILRQPWERDPAVWDLLIGSRLPRMFSGLVVGFALGVSGALLQSLVRNPLASPDTLAVNAGAYFAITLSVVLGVGLPILGQGALAFVGGLAAAGTVLLLAGRTSSASRTVLAGSALMLVLVAATSALLLLFEEATTGLYAWGSGSLSQTGLDAVTRIAPLVAVVVVIALLLSRRLDLLLLGEDTAAALGVPVRSTRVIGCLLAVLLAAAAVTLAGPMGFVGLCAPALVRMVGSWERGLLRHAVRLPAAGLAGATLVLFADVALRALIGSTQAISVPTGVTTTLLGGVVLVLLARRAGYGREAGSPADRATRSRSGARAMVVIGVLAVGVAALGVLGLMAGFNWFLLGDLVNWVRGDAVPVVTFAMDERTPRVGAALVGGLALALAGTAVQAVCRNPLAEPGLLGITGGAGLAAVLVIMLSPGIASTLTISLAAGVGALIAFATVYLLAWRGTLQSERLVLVGLGVWYATTAATTLLVVQANPYDTPRVFTWLSGSTYGRSWGQVAPVIVAVLLALPLLWALHRELDLLAIDDDVPRLVGLRLERIRLLVLIGAAILASTAVSAVGVVGFVGLMAPHAARALVGSRHVVVIPTAALLGAGLLSLADTLGRVVVAPAQIPAGLVVALVGAPYFLYLLHRTRA